MFFGMKKWYKACPFCWEEIREIAKKCRFCGEFLEEEKEVQYEHRCECWAIVEEWDERCQRCGSKLYWWNAKVSNWSSEKKMNVWEIIAIIISSIFLFIFFYVLTDSQKVNNINQKIDEVVTGNTYDSYEIDCNKMIKEKYELISNHTAYYVWFMQAIDQNGVKLPEDVRQKLFDNINNNTKKFISDYSNTFYWYNPGASWGWDIPSSCSSSEAQDIKSYDNMYFSLKKCLDKNNTLWNLLDCNTSLAEVSTNKLLRDAWY